MPSPERPPPWQLRTRRFWFGVSVFVMLTCLWLSGLFRENSIRYYYSTSTGTHDFGVTVKQGMLSIQEVRFPGTLSVSSLKPGWTFGGERPSGGLLFWPKPFIRGGLDIIGMGPAIHAKMATIHLPLWPLPLLWLIAWPLWMRRRARKEQAYFEGLQK